MLERLEKACTRSQPIACALGSGLPFGGICHEEERGPVRDPHVDDVHHVHEANRGLEGSVRRCGETNWQKRSAISQLDFCDASFRVGSSIKDSRVRREPRTGPGLSSGGGRHDPSFHHSPKTSFPKSLPTHGPPAWFPSVCLWSCTPKVGLPTDEPCICPGMPSKLKLPPALSCSGPCL